MPEELGFKASIEGFDKVEAGLNAITKDLTATSNAANKLSAGPLKAVSKSLDGLTLSSDKFNTASKKTTVELAATAMQASKVDSSLKKAAAGTNTAAFALTNLGRIAQDAPFGFIGIQNNLNPLLESINTFFYTGICGFHFVSILTGHSGAFVFSRSNFSSIASSTHAPLIIFFGSCSSFS